MTRHRRVPSGLRVQRILFMLQLIVTYLYLFEMPSQAVGLLNKTDRDLPVSDVLARGTTVSLNSGI